MTIKATAYVVTSSGIFRSNNVNPKAFNPDHVVVAGRTQREANTWATAHGLKGARLVSPHPLSHGPRGVTGKRAIFITPELDQAPDWQLKEVLGKARHALFDGAPLLPKHYVQEG